MKIMQLIKNIQEFIFEEERPFKSCHASTLVKLDDGSILVAWFGGSREGADDVAIWMSRKQDGKWSYPVKVADIEGIPHWNPVLFRKKDGRIILYYKVGHKIPSWYTLSIYSDDGGITWSEPKELVPGDVGGRGPVKNKPIVLSDGTWAAPASLEGKYWDAFVDLSYDEGETWQKSGIVPYNHDDSMPGKGIIQPTLWESAPGHVHMLLRSTAARIFRSDSTDYGKTWCPAYPTYLPNNNSGIDLDRADDGTLVLAYNPVGMYKGPRTPLILGISEDNGGTWKQGFILEKFPGEFSYPAVVIKGKTVYVTYTWHRERIVFCELMLTP